MQHPSIELNELSKTAIEAAQLGGSILTDYAKKGFEIEKKSDINLLTEADLASERVIVEKIRTTFPSHQILAEEKGLQTHSENPYKWIIDPLDGTTNFAHGFPMYNVSIGVEYEGAIVVGVVFDPTRNELFVAQKGQGSTLNNVPIHVSATALLSEALLVTGFAYDIHTVADNNLKEFCAFSLRARGMRRTGTAAIDLCYIACGRFDGFWELKLNPWDTAAGKLIVQEAGGQVTNYQGEPYSIYGQDLIASNGLIHQEMVGLLQEIRFPNRPS
ncbi:MAG: inositol monophosphatase [Nitrospirales bacterium]|nr:inositol monophosphatase [Nitrospira sp.]MDR4500595.1 inositol monophosphatase [Nitrospirales bacterium]